MLSFIVLFVVVITCKYFFGFECRKILNYIILSFAKTSVKKNKQVTKLYKPFSQNNLFSFKAKNYFRTFMVTKKINK